MEDVRRRGRRARRQGRGGRQGRKALVAALVASAGAVGWLGAGQAWPTTTTPSAEASVTAAEQGFSLRLLEKTASATPTADVTTSAFSLADALVMLETGARGETLRQIASTLGTASLTPAEQDLGWSRLDAALVAEARRDRVTLDAADGLWLQSGFPVLPSFLSSLRRYFATGTSSVNFAHALAAALGSINAWVRAHTDGKITQLFGPNEISAETRLVLASAVYFHAAWQEPFNPTRTVPGSFILPPGSSRRSVPVKMMTGDVTGAVATPAYDVARLAYLGGHDEADLVMPLQESVPALLRGLGAARLDSMLAAASSPALVQLPRFTTTSDLDLGSVLSAMGMPQVFTPDADLSAMSTVPTHVQAVVQRDYLKVTEAGTEAAAATGISTVPTAVAPSRPAIVFDRPFLFVIRNTTTGALLFAAAIENPAQ